MLKQTNIKIYIYFKKIKNFFIFYLKNIYNKIEKKQIIII